MRSSVSGAAQTRQIAHPNARGRGISHLALPRALVAVLVVVLATAAAGCRHEPADDSEASTGSGGRLLRTLPPPEGRLDLLAWPGYLEDGSDDPRLDWVTPFERASGCKVRARRVTSSDEVVELLETGQYDGASVPGEATGRLAAAGLVSRLATGLIANFADVYPALRRTPSNSVGSRVYGVPQGRGASLLLWRTDVVRPAPDSWAVVFDRRSPYRGRVTGFDSPLSIADAAIYLRSARPELGIRNVYRLDQRQFAAALALLRGQREVIGGYWSDTVHAHAAFAAGTAVVGAAWQPVADLLRSDRVPVRAILPREGATGWSDSWMIASSARHPGCMYRWMNWMLSPKINAAVAESFGQAPSNPKACAFTSDPRHCTRYHANDERFFRRVELWSTPRRECGDGRGRVCKSWDDWVEAWDEID
jgi:putative spermidine/putrescine transport system substrate-binding protein